jgi:predicted PurR-regulated permease PerM
VARDTPRALIRYALVALVVTVVLVYALYLARGALLLIYLSALVATGVAPMVESLERRQRRRLPRWVAILFVYACFLTIAVGLLVVVIPPLIEQARQFWAAVPRMLHAAQQWLVDRGVLARELSVTEALAQTPVGGDAIGTVVGAVWGVVGGIFGVVTILILAFYFLLDSENLVRTFVRLFPRAEQRRVESACLRMSGKISAWLGGQLLLGGIIGSTAAIGLFLLGVPYFYVLALIAGIGEMIPIIGPILAAIPAVAVGFSVSPAIALAVAIFFFLQQQVENHVLVPKIMERQVGVSAAGVIVALLIGGTLLGVLGAVLAVPTLAILKVVFEDMTGEAAADE